MSFESHSAGFSYSERGELRDKRSNARGRGRADLAKAVFDRCFAVFALLFFAPFLIIISLVIFLGDGGPILFRHKRVGRDGRIFSCLKFRTMANDAEDRLKAILASDPKARAEWEANQKLEDDPRITCVGEFFRKTSLDELPQFWNVLRGEMSVVGPRPIVADEARHYGEHFEDYLSVRPGVTGLWQVMGRSRTTYDERVAMDVDYVRNRSFRMDLWIILKTVKVMLFRDGAC
jgi:exopolysaccharide production protein ExoY